MQKWLHETLHWSQQKATQAAQKRPQDQEDQYERSFFRKVYTIKEEDIHAFLWVNLDQTQCMYVPGDKMTWAKTGSKQVPLIGGKEECAFTVMASIASDGTVLPMQAIYADKRKHVPQQLPQTTKT